MTSSPTDESNYFKTAELSRLMVPTDANMAGNIHGGTIMQMVEESACVAASRFFNHYGGNAQENGHVKVLTARVESVTFQKPLHVGDVAKVRARVVFSTKHTVAVAVKLLAERLTSKGEDVVGNRALLWIVGHVHKENHDMAKDENGIATVQKNDKFDLKNAPLADAPKVDPPADTDKEGLMAYKLAKMAYKKRKANQASDPAPLPDSDSEWGNANVTTENNEDAFSPEQSAVELAQVMLPSDCVTGAGLVRGGIVMKLMDNASGVVAVRHCGTNIVTISVDAMDLVAPVFLGDVLKIRAKPIFTSAKSMEIQVTVVAERFSRSDEGKLERQEIVSTKQAYYTFVSLGPDGKTLPMRPLAPITEEDKKLFREGKERYEQRKALRSS